MIRTVVALIAKIPEHKIHVISPDIGGGFGNKVGAYPGYICAAVASIVTGKPVKWVEDRIENLTATAFARDYHMTTEIAATKDGKVTGLRVHVLADHGGFDACAEAAMVSEHPWASTTLVAARPASGSGRGPHTGCRAQAPPQDKTAACAASGQRTPDTRPRHTVGRPRARRPGGDASRPWQ